MDRPVLRLEDLKSKDPLTRALVVRGLQTIPPEMVPFAIPALIAALGDSVPRVQLMIVGTLGHFGPAASDAVPDLESLLSKFKRDERQLVEWALSQIRDGGCVSQLAREIANPFIKVWDVVKAADNHDYVRFATRNSGASPVHSVGCSHPDCVARRKAPSDASDAEAL